VFTHNRIAIASKDKMSNFPGEVYVHLLVKEGLVCGRASARALHSAQKTVSEKKNSEMRIRTMDVRIRKKPRRPRAELRINHRQKLHFIYLNVRPFFYSPSNAQVERGAILSLGHKTNSLSSSPFV